jgi:hypothetical protein
MRASSSNGKQLLAVGAHRGAPTGPPKRIFVDVLTNLVEFEFVTNNVFVIVSLPDTTPLQTFGALQPECHRLLEACYH